MNYNDIIKRLLAQNLYTQEFVANELNICQRTYCDYELRLHANSNRKFDKISKII